ncbi:MAG: hypothetical protein ABIF01_00015 [Candidatus Micrarchaeota archaeon]
MEFKFSRRNLAFLVVFGIAALLAARMNFSPVLGAENQSFTVFQFFGPVAASFIGPVLGLSAILASEIANVLLLGKSFTLFEIARLFPMLFAAYYFAKGKNPLGTALPLGCMALFALHPVGGQAWIYSLYWLIPVIAAFFPERLVGRALGATFTAHAVGSVAYLYMFQSTPAFWLALIPVVAVERLLFASGISVSYVALNTFLAKVESKFDLRALSIDRRYVLG